MGVSLSLSPLCAIGTSNDELLVSLSSLRRAGAGVSSDPVARVAGNRSQHTIVSTRKRARESEKEQTN